jgi:hypothetical protein
MLAMPPVVMLIVPSLIVRRNGPSLDHEPAAPGVHEPPVCPSTERVSVWAFGSSQSWTTYTQVSYVPFGTLETTRLCAQCCTQQRSIVARLASVDGDSDRYSLHCAVPLVV